MLHGKDDLSLAVDQVDASSAHDACAHYSVLRELQVKDHHVVFKPLEPLRFDLFVKDRKACVAFFR